MKDLLKCSSLTRVATVIIAMASVTSKFNVGAKRVMARGILMFIGLLILGNITTAQAEEVDFGLCATYTNPVIVEGPLSFGLSSLPTEVNSCFQFAAPMPVSGVYISPSITSASLAFGNAVLTVADLYTGDDDVYPIYAFRLDSAGDIDRLQYGFLFSNNVVTEGIVLNSSFEMNITGTDIASGQPFHYRYTTSSQTLSVLPVASWPADGDATDATGNGNDGTLNGNTTYVDGRCDGQAFSFDGDGDYVGVPHSDDLSITGPMTITAWINGNSWFESSGEYGFNVIASKGGLNAVNYTFRVDTHSGFLTFFYGINQAWQGWTDNRPLSLNTWHHVAAVEYDDGTIDFYIDGVKASGSVAWNSPSTIKKVANSDPLRIGDIYGWDQEFAGAIDNLEIYSRALSEAEIQAIYNECSNNPPVAMCSDVSIDAGADCTANSASIDKGSHDPDGNPITITQNPAGPYVVGDTEVTLTVTDEDGESDSCTATVTVVDNSCPTVTATLVQLNGKKRKGCFRVDLSASDNCDLDPQIVATINFGTNGSAGVVDGQLVELRKKKKFKVKTGDGDSSSGHKKKKHKKKNKHHHHGSDDDSSSDDCGTVRFEGPSFTLTANAIDSAGNVACDVDEVIFTFDDGSSDDKSSDNSSSDDGTDTVPCPPNCPL